MSGEPAAHPNRPAIARAALALPLAAVLAGCAIGGAVSVGGTQPFPRNHRSEIPAFLRTYLINPVGLREAMMAEPVERPIGRDLRYVSCVRFREAGKPQELAIVHLDGRLDHVAGNAQDLCAGVVYAPFPELEKLSR